MVVSCDSGDPWLMRVGDAVGKRSCKEAPRHGDIVHSCLSHEGKKKRRPLGGVRQRNSVVHVSSSSGTTTVHRALAIMCIDRLHFPFLLTMNLIMDFDPSLPSHQAALYLDGP
ncbi:hypothetical protein SESBI_15388 [Sesbania bispinosa]|nr:hypothetical protein SESBI_15388 [Sesbania bispinosa]